MIERLVAQQRRQGLGLRAALFVKRNIDLSLEAALCVPRRASVPYEGEVYG